MAVMASWNGKTWGVSSQRIAALNGVSSSVELDTENSDDKAGSPATKTKALKLQSMSFDFDLASAVGGDARGEFESWTSLVGQYAPFYLAGRRNINIHVISVKITKNLDRCQTFISKFLRPPLCQPFRNNIQIILYLYKVSLT